MMADKLSPTVIFIMAEKTDTNRLLFHHLSTFLMCFWATSRLDMERKRLGPAETVLGKHTQTTFLFYLPELTQVPHRKTPSPHQICLWWEGQLILTAEQTFLVAVPKFWSYLFSSSPVIYHCQLELPHRYQCLSNIQASNCFSSDVYV